MGGGANNKAVHTWARKFNMTTGSLVKDWHDTEDGRRDYEEESARETEEEEIQRETDSYFEMVENEKLTDRLKKLLDDLLGRWEKLPNIPGRDRKALQGEIDAGSGYLDARELEDAEYALEKAAGMMPVEEGESAKLAKELADKIGFLRGEIDEMLNAADKLQSLLASERKRLDGFRERGKKAAEELDLAGARKCHGECDQIVEQLFNDKATIQKRLETLVATKAADRIIFEAWEMFTTAGGVRKELGLGKPAYNKVISLTYQRPSVYKIIDQQKCIAHALERHTFVGILKAGKILTAHVSMVAICEDDTEIRKAVRGASTDPEDWKKLKNGFDGTTVGGFKVYGGITGDTVALQTCFPVGGVTEYDQGLVQLALDHAKGNLRNFIRLIKGEITLEELEEEEREGEK